MQLYAQNPNNVLNFLKIKVLKCMANEIAELKEKLEQYETHKKEI